MRGNPEIKLVHLQNQLKYANEYKKTTGQECLRPVHSFVKILAAYTTMKNVE